MLIVSLIIGHCIMTYVTFKCYGYMPPEEILENFLLCFFFWYIFLLFIGYEALNEHITEHFRAKETKELVRKMAQKHPLQEQSSNSPRSGTELGLY